MKTVVITGASSGIGEAAARRMARAGWQVFAGVRNDDDAARLADGEERIVPLRLDVTDRDDVGKAADAVAERLDGATLAGLVNNAGIAKMAPLTLQPLDEIEAHFRVNVFGAVAMCQAFAPLLGQDRARRGDPGRIVNITSLGGIVASPFLGAYTATKHAMESVTDTLRRELAMFGIDSIVVGPGAVKTPIWSKAQADGGPPYGDTPWADSLATFLKGMVESGENGLTAEHIAGVVETALTHPRPKARYAPVPNKLTNYYLLRALPKRWVDKIFVSRLGLDKPADSATGS